MKHAQPSCILLIILLFASIQVQGFAIPAVQQKETSMLLRVYEPFTQITLSNLGEIVSSNPENWVDLVVSSSSLSEITDRNVKYEILNEDIDTVPTSIRLSYHTLAEMEQILTEINDQYPSITSLFSIGSTYEDREILCLEITDNPGVDEQEPGVLFMGVHHAREWPTMEICLTIAKNLTMQYSTNQTIKDLVDNRRIWIIPCVNPDGYYFSHDYSIQHDWRKNRHYFPSFGTYGVDINRNYDGSVNGDPLGMWGSIGEASVSHDPLYELYCGPTPSSEAETRAVKEFFINNDISASISFHTYGEYVMWPWGYSDTVQIPEEAFISEIGRSIAEEISTQDGKDTYTPMQGVNLYPTTGDFADWAYGYSHYVLGRTHLTYTIEACTEFHPSEEYLPQICSENYDGALVLLKAADTIKQRIPRVLPPLIQKTTSQDFNYTVSWIQQNPAAQPSRYQIDELVNVTYITDTAEDENDFWTFDGFTKTMKRSHSNDTSYTTLSANRKVFSMTSTTPLPIDHTTKLSFWCWYDIEDQKDMAFIEVSTDNRFYEVVDTFTGSSGGWVLKEYPLQQYRDSSIFLRFRYSTDDTNLFDGFYVDDICPLPVFSSVKTLSDSLTETSLSLIQKSIGTYYYRVKGYNDEFGWGDFSPLRKILVGIEENMAPSAPNINGETQGKAGTEYSFTFQSTDENDDDLYYYVDWGDGQVEEWIGPFKSGQQMVLNHTWKDEDDFIIRAIAKDIFDQESEWATLEISMPFMLDHVSFFIKILKHFSDFYMPFLRFGSGG